MDETLTPLDRAVLAFGSLEAVGAAVPAELGGPLARSTVAHWRGRRQGRIPDKYHHALVASAAAQGVRFTAEDCVS